MLGSELLKRKLSKLNKNVIVIGIDNLVLGKKKFIQKELKNKNFFFFNIDLSKKINDKKIIKIFKKSLINEAWLFAANSDIKLGSKKPEVDLKNTFLSTFNSLQLIENYLNKKSKIIFSSSSAIYGSLKKKLNENTPPIYPISNYGSMKLASEALISSFSYKKNIKSFIFRFPNVIGRNLTHGVLYDFKKKFKNKNKFVQVLGNGLQKKPYADANEILDSMKYLINKGSKFVNYFNIGPADRGVKVKFIVNEFKKYFPKKKIKYQNKKYGWIGDVTQYHYDTSKMTSKGFKFKKKSSNTIRKTISEILLK